jgi:PAS domain S-box-containing protein
VGELVERFNRMAASLEHQHDEVERTAQSLAALLESTDEGIYGVDLKGKVTLVNRAALELTGFSGEELMWSPSHELIHHTRADGTPYPADQCPVAIAMRTGQGVRVTEEVYWRKDGSSFPVEYSASPLMQGGEIVGAVVSFVDVSSRRHLQRLRNAQHAMSRALAEATSLEGARPQMMGSVAAALGFDLGVTWEPGPDGILRRITTYAAPGLEDLAARLGPDELPQAGTLAGRAIVRRDPVLELDLEHHPPRPDGLPDTRLQMAAATPVFGSDGRLISVGEMFARQPIPEEGMVDTLRAVAGQAAQYIERQRAQAETQRLKDQFVSTVSHELRTPLTAIDGWIHILLGEEPGPLTADQRRFLETVKRNSSRLKRLVGDLLLAGQIDTGRFKLELSDVDVAEVLKETGELVSASAQNNDLALTIDADEPVMIRGDRERLGQLIGNLLSNAIKYTPAGGSVEARVEADGGTCRITVSDTGIGIPPADRKHLFERFYRASSATESGIVGTGLGLAISATIAESHHGRIELVDRDGPGSTFVVELPLLVREEAPT